MNATIQTPGDEVVADLKKHPYQISIRDIAWLEKAAMKPWASRNDAMTHAAVFIRDGRLTFAASDTHRVHYISLDDDLESNLPDVSVEDLNPMAPAIGLDIRRILLEAKYRRARFAAINSGFSSVWVGTRPWGQGIWWPIEVRVVHRLAYPHYGHILPASFPPARELSALNPKFVADALSHADDGATAIVIGQEKKDGPVWFKPASNDDWLAGVMPRSDYVNASVGTKGAKK